MAPIAKSTRAKTSNAKTKKVSTVEIGRSGSNIFKGLVNDEYNPELQGVKAIKLYDKMRKSDGTVRAAMASVQLPIRRAEWHIKPASEDERDLEIKDFIEDALFEQMSITWDDFLRQALLHTTFGVMAFEKVFAVRNIEGQDMIVWEKFAPRLPQTIIRWEQADGTPGIEQLPPTASGMVSIPAEKLLIFVNELEGENYWGVSLLRAAYKHWYIKSNIERIDAIAYERQGLGIPYVKLNSTHTDADITKAETLLQNLRAHEQGYLIEPDDITVEFKDMKANTTRDPARAIEYHDRLIVKSVLAQFLNLGSSTSGGSRALSEDQSGMFLQSVEAIANNIADTINKYAIKELVDLNFDGVTDYPKLDYSGVSRIDIDALSTSYQRLTQSGGIKASEADDRHFRGLMGLPDNDDEEPASEDKPGADGQPSDAATADKATQDLGLQAVANKKKVENSEVAKAIQKKLDTMTVAEEIDFIKASLHTIKDLRTHRKVFASATLFLNARLGEVTRYHFADNNEFKSWRKLSFTEKKVNWQSIQDTMDTLEASLSSQSKEILQSAKNSFLKDLTSALHDNDTSAIKDLTWKFQKEYTGLLNDLLKQSYEFAKNNAAREMGVKAPSNDRQVLKSINIAADNIASQHASAIVADAKTMVTDGLAKGKDTSDILASVNAAINTSIDALTQDTASIVVAGHMNLGRSTVFNANAGDIHALVRSELLDNKTCNFCLSMDGRIIDKKDPLADSGNFHSNCRGIWVEILNDEVDLPEITGVPQSLRDRVGEMTNELVQPPKPMVKKDSPAADYMAKASGGK